MDLGSILSDPILLSLLLGNFLDPLEISESPFNWLVFDAQASILGLDVKAAAVPLPPALTLLASALLGIFAGIQRHR